VTDKHRELNMRPLTLMKICHWIKCTITSVTVTLQWSISQIGVFISRTLHQCLTSVQLPSPSCVPPLHHLKRTESNSHSNIYLHINRQTNACHVLRPVLRCRWYWAPGARRCWSLSCPHGTRHQTHCMPMLRSNDGTCTDGRTPDRYIDPSPHTMQTFPKMW